MPSLRIGGESFAARETLSAFQLMKLADAQQRADKGDTMAALSGFSRFLEHVIVPEERDRWAAWQDEHDEITFDDLTEAIGTLMVELTGRPTEAPSLSQPGRSPNGGTSNHVSSSPATVPEEHPSSMVGTPAA